jgi:hypothetical protein
VTAGRPDWHALARAVRDEIVPGFRPATSLAIKAALAAQSPGDSDAELTDYPPLRDEVLAEFQRVAQEQAHDADFPDGADSDGDDYDEPYEDDGDTEPYEQDGTADDEEEPGGAQDGSDLEDQQDGDDPGQGRSGTGTGTGGGSTEPAGGSQNGSAANGHSRDHGNGAAAGERKRRTSKKNGGRPDSQLISYVSPNLTDRSPSRNEDGTHEQHLRDAAGEAGVDLVIKHLETELRESGSRIEKMPEKNKGYDILVRDANDEPQCYIEVKATAGAWGLRGVGLTDPQFTLARIERERYVLYVVEHLYQPQAHLWWIRDPAGRVDYFHYDRGWQTAAEGQAAVTGADANQRT